MNVNDYLVKIMNMQSQTSSILMLSHFLRNAAMLSCTLLLVFFMSFSYYRLKVLSYLINCNCFYLRVLSRCNFYIALCKFYSLLVIFILNSGSGSFNVSKIFLDASNDSIELTNSIYLSLYVWTLAFNRSTSFDNSVSFCCNSALPDKIY
jgi:hypothetical protein